MDRNNSNSQHAML